MRIHEIKVWSEYWDALEDGDKPFEVRRDDRGYQKGDMLVLCKWDRLKDCFVRTGDNSQIQIRRKITYILTGGQFGIEPGYVVLGLKKT